MRVGWAFSWRVFLAVAVVMGAVVASLVTPLWRAEGLKPRGFPPSQTLSEAYMALMCRPPNDAETLRWDTKTFTVSELAASVRATLESERLRAIRRVYIDVLRRDPFEGDCAALRTWVDRAVSVEDIARRLAASPEARRVEAVRAVLTEVEGRDPGGWDNATIRRWAQSGLTPAEIRTAVRARRPLVGVHYFLWYMRDGPRWGNGATSVPVDTPRPALGWYESGDEAVIDAQIAQMEAAGFDFVIVQIVAEDPEIWETARRFFARLQGRRLKAVVMLDGLYMAPASVVTSWVQKARAEFASHPNYLWQRRQPLVLLYSARLDFPVPGVLIRNVYWGAGYGQGDNMFNPDKVLYPHDWAFWAPTPQPIVNGAVPVVPGYSDSHLQREEQMEHARDDGRMYHEQWQRALALRPEFILVYSWNEHFERTAIEPTDAWGDRYLRWTACYAAHARAGRVDGC